MDINVTSRGGRSRWWSRKPSVSRTARLIAAGTALLVGAAAAETIPIATLAAVTGWLMASAAAAA